MELNTFSICARCDKTGQLGVAVSTAVPNVGSLCPYVKAELGAISVQSLLNQRLGVDGLKLLAKGKRVEEVLEVVLSKDKDKNKRQLGIVDNNGNSCAWTGKDCLEWSGHINDKNISVQGNLLISEDVIKDMYDVFQSTGDLSLKERLMLALEAGDKRGGDKRGGDFRSAALIIYSKEERPTVNLRVDSHPFPVVELRKLLGEKYV